MNEGSKNAFLELCEGAPVEVFRAGEVLMRQGEDAGYCLVILSGSVSVDIVDARTRATRVATRAAGELIGELSLFQKRRCATVTAATPCQCARIPHPALLQLVTTRPELALALLAATMDKAREVA